MKKISYIARKELGGFLRSAPAFLVLISSNIIFNVLFFMIVDQGREATLRDVFKVMEFIFIFVIPILTMKVFAEEKMTGTLEFLMTTPTRNFEIVIGKYLGVFGFYLLIVFFTIPYYFLLHKLGNPDTMEMFLGYSGIVLEGAVFTAIGLMTSSLTKSHIAAAMSAYAILFFLYFSLSFTIYLEGALQILIKKISILSHSENFFTGILTTADIIYLISAVIAALVLTTLFIDTKVS